MENERVVRVGVLGIGRGNSMIKYCKTAPNARLVAICDKWEEGLRKRERELNDPSVAFYTSFDEFLHHDMDVVILANYAHQHAPFAIRAMKAGFHVISEVLPCQTMQEAVQLVETVEQTGKIYCYAENYCYMAAPYEMRRLYRAGEIGEIEYGEGEYIHNCEKDWPSLTHGDRHHWRNHNFANFYCTHSLGPMIHITGLRPVSVNGFEFPYTDQCRRMGKVTGIAGVEMVRLENGALIRSTHGNLKGHSYWYSIRGAKGLAESAREAEPNSQKTHVIRTVLREKDDSYLPEVFREYKPTDELTAMAEKSGHGGSDFYCMYNCMEKILGNPEADTIDVYEAMDMFLPGLFAYRSVLAGGVTMDIPDLRRKEERDRYRNDTACADPAVAGDQWFPAYSKGEPEIPDEVYDRIRRLWLEKQKKEQEKQKNSEK